MTSTYFQRLERLKNSIEKEMVPLQELPDEFAFFSLEARNLDGESRNKALGIISEIIDISIEKTRLDIAGLIGVVGGHIVELDQTDPMIIFPQTYNLFMNVLNIAKPILKIYKYNPNQDPHELNKQYPERFFAWLVLDDAWRPIYAIVSNSEKARNMLSNNSQFLKFLTPYLEYHEGCKKIHRVLKQ
ncbi:MAG: hypothetical protein GF411_19285 [Candidatus Lokiarchaeota archaeon]|nr:hypothetical protein [Candidatus Lokiarchaeota archaeon]